MPARSGDVEPFMRLDQITFATMAGSRKRDAEIVDGIETAAGKRGEGEGESPREEFAGLYALVAAVATNHTIVTLSVRETGLDSAAGERLLDAWVASKERNAADLLL